MFRINGIAGQMPWFSGRITVHDMLRVLVSKHAAPVPPFCAPSSGDHSSVAHHGALVVMIAYGTV